MTEEKIKLLELLYDKDYPSEWEYREDISEYLNKLGRYKVEDLIKQPKYLENEHQIIQEQTQDLAVSNYKTFIETAECSKELFTQFNVIEHKLDQLLVDLPNFQEKCSRFSQTTGQISNLRKLNSLTLTKNAQLLEILELPQLMNSFINDELYEDALELAAYVRKLCSKYRDIPIFNSILNDVNQAWLLMLHQLLSQLKQELTLPKCIQIVGYLRRMEVFTELELKLKFLQARHHWLDHCVKYIPKDEPNHHLTKTIEITRVNLFNIITQYKAIFNDDESMSNTSLRNDVNPNIIFYTWINDRIDDFLKVLKDDLKSVQSVETILDQCMYFGQSFSKVGCDFRSLLVPIFTNQILENFRNCVAKAMISFEKTIEHFTLINKNLPNIPWKTKDQDALHPPDTLLEFYPLAEYLNNILKILNNFRACAPISIVNEVIDSLQKSLVFISKSLLILYSQEQQAFTSTSKDAFTRLCMCFSDDLIPYVQKCVHIIYPPNQIALKLGISVQTLQNEKISFLDKNLIVEPIRHLLPPKIEPQLSFESKNNLGEDKRVEVEGFIKCERNNDIEADV
ncbi:conserved oligomeric Golgi complex subunit 8 [Anthonomus grandis grandis]|uniref:conserved oligomeric Golgi complex subunit 8 n=1 Tax=Anthonomus grandis grandis TaxID=2921223 RepID=UPI0021660D6E|nr:conserved oligomeric Golgi complex subunit 8 [Anthonomus grandis grandis]